MYFLNVLMLQVWRQPTQQRPLADSVQNPQNQTRHGIITIGSVLYIHVHIYEDSAAYHLICLGEIAWW